VTMTVWLLAAGIKVYHLLSGHISRTSTTRISCSMRGHLRQILLTRCRNACPLLLHVKCTSHPLSIRTIRIMDIRSRVCWACPTIVGVHRA
jgi:hypothetical protein